MTYVKHQTDIERFWHKTKALDGCLLWSGGLDKDGYGKFQTGGHRKQKHHRAHRWIYEQSLGSLGGSLLLHSCHNPACVALHHLQPGTQKENVSHAIKRGLHASVGRWR